MNTSKILPVGLVAIMAVMSVQAVATAQTAMEKEMQAPKAMNIDVRGHGDKHGKRGGRGMMRQILQKVDVDGDGVVTQAEMDAKFGNVVERMDRNDDGKLDRDDRRGHDRKGHGRDDDRRGDSRG